MKKSVTFRVRFRVQAMVGTVSSILTVITVYTVNTVNKPCTITVT